MCRNSHPISRACVYNHFTRLALLVRLDEKAERAPTLVRVIFVVPYAYRSDYFFHIERAVLFAYVLVVIS